MEALGRRVTVGDVASKAGVSLAQAEEALNALAADSAGSLEVRPRALLLVQANSLFAQPCSARIHVQVSTAGEVLYTLPNNFKAVIRGRSWILRSQPAFRCHGASAGPVLCTKCIWLTPRLFASGPSATPEGTLCEWHLGLPCWPR